MKNQSVTRRTALKTSLGVLVATGGVAAVTSRAQAQSAKAAPASVDYQTQPKNGDQCSGCAYFIAPGSCSLVSGVISPNGWCELYSPKS